MKLFVRIFLLAVMVVLGFTAVFPEWLDLKDQVVVERTNERIETERREQDADRKQKYQDQTAALKALEPNAQPFAQRVLSSIEAGNYDAPYRNGTLRFQSTQAQASLDKLRAIYQAMGPELSVAAAQSKPGYGARPQSRAYLQSGARLITESKRWSENALLLQTLELVLVDDQLQVDGMVLEVLLYPDHPGPAEHVRGPHVFR